VFLQQLPSFFIRLRPVLPVDAGADLAILRHLVQALLYRDANVASGTGRAVPVDQLQNGASLLSGQRKFAIQALQSFMDERHIGFEVNGSNDDLNLARTIGPLPCEWSLPVYGTPLVVREADGKPQADPRKKGAAGNCGAIEHKFNPIARLR
jgi:hypothetical protein